MTSDSYFSRYQYAARSVPFSVYVGGFKLVGKALRKTALAIASGIVDKARAFETNRRNPRHTLLPAGISEKTLQDIGIRGSEIQFLARKMAENPGVDYRVFYR